ncbi:phospholipid phosphatase 2-like [Littorina saxatilis]|uniref:Phosphatidic acid phosphatase type 2/haloperoxidase domain-containing protein n=1 Tax=Littorina saxatilis TaxID=31220 RepID=A0AAN9G280_9CAEN
MGFSELRRAPTIVNALCWVAVFVVSVAFFLKPIAAAHRGFFCDDEAIRYPFRHDTVSVSLLVVTCLIPAVVLVFALEVTYGVLTNKHRSGHDTCADDKSRCSGLHTGLRDAGLVFACFMYGNALCFVLTEVFKVSFGRLRPSFLSACQPETDVTSFANCSGLYVEDIVCLNPDTKLMSDMRKSFVSGHASFSVFNMLFIILYLQRRLPFSTPRLVVSLLQSGALGYAIFVMASRIFDHYHHPQDILGGAILGVVICLVTVFKICPRFILHPPRMELEQLPVTVNTKQGTAPPPTSSKTKE